MRMHQPANLVSELADGRYLVDSPIQRYGAPWHFIEVGLDKTLNQSFSAGLLQGDKPLGAVLQQAGQDDPNGSFAGIPGQAREQQVNVVAPVEAIRDQVRHEVRPDRQMTGRSAEVALASTKRFALPCDHHWEAASLCENVLQPAFALHRPMEHDQHRRREIRRQCVE